MCKAARGHSRAPEDHSSNRQAHTYNSGFLSVFPSKLTQIRPTEVPGVSKA